MFDEFAIIITWIDDFAIIITWNHLYYKSSYKTFGVFGKHSWYMDFYAYTKKIIIKTRNNVSFQIVKTDSCITCVGSIVDLFVQLSNIFNI